MNSFRLRFPTLFALVTSLPCFLFGFGLPVSRAADGGQCLVYFGTYTGAKSKGIYVSRLNQATGALSPAELAAEITSPSFLAVHPGGKFLYAVNEVGEFRGQRAGSVSAFAIDRATGKLTLLNQQSARGSGPCHAVVDKDGRNVLVANYGGGSVAVLPIESDGRLKEASAFVQHTGSSVDPARQKEPHAHSINLDAANRFAFVADLGLDQVLVYRFDGGKGALTANDPGFARVKPGAGPRHFDFHPSGRFAYVINEMQSTLTAFSYNAERGVLTEMQTLSTLPSSFTGNSSTAEVRVHPSGRFVYGSNRGHNSIAVFRVDEKTGSLTWLENESTQGKTPRNFNLDPSGKWLLAANQDSDSVIVFKIDPQSGTLEPAGHTIEVGRPVCVRFVELSR